MIVSIYENLSNYQNWGNCAIVHDVDKVHQTDTGVYQLILKDSIMFIPSQYIVVVTELED